LRTKALKVVIRELQDIIDFYESYLQCVSGTFKAVINKATRVICCFEIVSSF